MLTNFEDFLKVLESYKLKQISRNCSNFYYCEKEDVKHKRKETTAEHIYSSLKLADYFLLTEKEFSQLDRLRVYELLMYHDDIEIDTKDVCISNREERKYKNEKEVEALPGLASRYPSKLGEKLLKRDSEFRERKTPESQFAHAVDKMDALIHELEYPQDWGPKGFDEKNVRVWFQHAFDYSPTFSKYFEYIIKYLNDKGYFKI
ncbi:MAG: HD domain-containing protein [Candidatus Aenigmarchaeota archaeon]|nr:HD domain-containing protein [Candidatus Aenigmarchaeota archaeon]